MKEIDLGYTENYDAHMEDPKAKKCYPTLHVNHMSEDDGMKIGEEFRAEVLLCKKGARKSYDGKGYDCEYEVKTIAPIQSKKEIKSFPEMLDEAAEG
jgi:hypothetical protein